MKFSLKKLALLGVFSLFLLLPTSNASAAAYLPSEIKLSDTAGTATPIYEAGSTQTAGISYATDETSINTQIEYGVARELKRGPMTRFETLSVNTAKISEIKDTLKVPIPNVSDEYASSTYVIYVKTFQKDDPDGEHFFITKSFQIKGNNELPNISVGYVTMLNSNGKSFSAKAGPTIYNPLKQADPSFSTSTSLEIVFESNQDIVIHPELNFGKLRTGDLDTKIEVGEVSIKKGQTTISIPLPTFDYVPGVYVGKIDFKTDLFKNPIDFQYIVGGDSVSVGEVSVADSNSGSVVTYSIFGSPLDIERLSESRNVKRNTIYGVTLNYIKGDKTVFTETKDVNFSSTTFQSLIPKSIRQIDKVTISVKSKITGEEIYTGTKDLGINKGLSTSTIVLIFSLLILIIIGVFIYSKKRGSRVVVAAIMFFAVFGLTRIALAWEPSSFVTSATNAGFTNEGVYENPRLYLNENISTKQYTVGDTMSFLFKASYVYCTNTGVGLSAGFSFVNDAAAISFANTPSGALDTTPESMVGYGNGGNHPIYRNTNSFLMWNMGTVTSTTTTLYAYVSEDLHQISSRVHDGATSYAIPLHIGPAAPVITASTSAQCGGKIAISWPAVTGADRYDIYQSSTSNGTFTQVGTTEQTSYISTIGVASTTYYYKVKAIGVQTSPFSNVVGASSSAMCPVGTPVLSCSASPSTANLGQTVHWTSSITNATATDYNYNWSGAVTGTNQNQDQVYGIEGTRAAWVSATLKTDSSKVYTADCSVSITNSGVGCTSGMKYCASTLQCIPNGDTCPSSCGSAVSTPVLKDTGLSELSAGLCGGSYSLLPGSMFPALSGTSIGAWKWICTTTASGQTTKIGCSANCATGTTYCAAKDACTTTCDTCPLGLRMNEVGACVSPTARIIYFKASPDVSSTTCPAFWNTDVNDGSHLTCTIDPGTSYAQSVPSSHLTAIITATSTVDGSDDAHVNQYGFSEDVFPLSPGVAHKLSCDVRTDDGNIFVKTITASARCYRDAKPIEI